MDPSVCLHDDFWESEQNGKDDLINAGSTGNKKSSSATVANVFETSETTSEDDNNNNNNNISAGTEEFLSSSTDAALDQTPNPTSCAHRQQSRPGAFGAAPGRAESSRIKGALTAQPDPTKKIDNLSLTSEIAPLTNNNAPTQDIDPTMENGLSNPLRSESANVQTTVDELHLRARARKVAKKSSGGTVQIMQETVMDRKLDQRLGIVAPVSDVAGGVEEVTKQFPEEEEMTIGPRMPVSFLNRSPVLVTEKSTLTLTIAAEVVDNDPADMEAQIQERVNCLRNEMIRDTVQADAVKVITENELHKPRLHYGYWLTLFLIIVTVGVTLGIVFSRQANYPQPQLSQPSQSPSESICTLCLDGTTELKYPDQQLPRQTEGFTCGSVASNPDLVIELLAASSGNCSADVQIYGQYCGCPSIAESTGKKCNFCRFGLHPSNNRSTPVYNDSCVELASFVSSLSSDLCSANSITDVLACRSYCQCPSSIPTCSLCPKFTDSPFQKQVDIPFFNMTCGNLNDYVSIFTADQCIAHQDDIRLAAGICGCPPLACSLCPLDDLKLQDVSLLSNFNNISCPALNGIIGSFSEVQCTTEQALITENNAQCCTPMTSVPVLPPSELSFQSPFAETFSPSIIPSGTFTPSGTFYPFFSVGTSSPIIPSGTFFPSIISSGSFSPSVTSPPFVSIGTSSPIIPSGPSSSFITLPGPSSPIIPSGTSSPSIILPDTSSPSGPSSPFFPIGTSSPSIILPGPSSPIIVSVPSSPIILSGTSSPSILLPDTSSPIILSDTSSPSMISSINPDISGIAPSSSCSLCPEGVPLPNPELVLSEGDSCGDLSDLANGLSPDQCVLQKDILTLSAVSCGCS